VCKKEALLVAGDRKRRQQLLLTLDPSNDLRVLRVGADFRVAAGDFLWKLLAILILHFSDY
jgi:hypothetical protein